MEGVEGRLPSRFLRRKKGVVARIIGDLHSKRAISDVFAPFSQGPEFLLPILYHPPLPRLPFQGKGARSLHLLAARRKKWPPSLSRGSRFFDVGADHGGSA